MLQEERRKGGFRTPLPLVFECPRITLGDFRPTKKVFAREVSLVVG